MNRQDVKELHYITPIENVPSILKNGILCHKKASKVLHCSVASKEIQERRVQKEVPGTRKVIHDYANLYFHARNPMLFLRKGQHENLCVLRISTDVMDIKGTVITDANASGNYVRFYPSPDGLEQLDAAMVFARDWRDPDQIIYWQKKSAKNAEVLIPDCLPPKYVIGAYVSCQKSENALAACASGLEITVDPDLFFQV